MHFQELELLEAALGTIVFGRNTDTPAGIQWTAAKLRQAAAMLEYRYAIERHHDATQETIGQAPVQSPVTGPGTVDGSQQGQQLSPAKPKRKRGRPSRANGATDHGPGLATPPAAEPLFPAEGAVE